MPRPVASVVALAADAVLEAWAADTAVALGRAWATPGAPVRLVDLSVWAPRLNPLMGVEGDRGATDVVLHGVDVEGVIHDVGPGLQLVAAGRRAWDPARILADARLNVLLAPPEGGTTLFLLPLELPGCERALRHAGAVVLLAPRHADPAFLLDEVLPRTVAWWGPDAGEGSAEEDAVRDAPPPPAATEGPARSTEAVEDRGESPSLAAIEEPERSTGDVEVRDATPPSPAARTPGDIVEPRRPDANVPRPAPVPAVSGDPSPTAPPSGTEAVPEVTPILIEPRAAATEEARGVVGGRAARPQVDDSGRWTILLAEDNDDHALLVQMSLGWASRKPVELYRARNGDEAIRLLDSLRPDLLLLDLKMPGRSGHEVLEHVKGSEALRRIPVAVLTSSDRDEDVERAYGLGGNHFLTKPDDPRKLQAQLCTLLDNLWELRSIRRGRGVIEATGVTAEGPPSPVLLRAARVGLIAAVLGALLALAWWSGLFG